MTGVLINILTHYNWFKTPEFFLVCKLRESDCITIFQLHVTLITLPGQQKQPPRRTTRYGKLMLAYCGVE